MDKLMIQNNAPTMSSLEIAALTGKEHKSVMRDIRVMLKQLNGTDLYHQQNQVITIKCPQTKRNAEYLLPRRETEILITGYDVVRRAAVIDRWFQLENAQRNNVTSNGDLLSNPTALREMLLGYTEKVIKLESKVETLQNLFHSGGTIPQFAKQLNGVNSQKVTHWLSENTSWLYNSNKGKINAVTGKEKPAVWRAASAYRDKYITEEATNIARHGQEERMVYSVTLLAKGKQKLHDFYLNEKLPMKASWNGKFVHEKEFIKAQAVQLELIK